MSWLSGARSDAAVKSTSIRKKILFPMLLSVILEAGIFCSAIFLGGTVGRLTDNAYDLLSEQVTNRRNYVEEDMVGRWGHLSDAISVINGVTKSQIASSGLKLEEIIGSSEHTAELLRSSSDYVIEIMRRNDVTGAFFIIDNAENPQLEHQYDALYFRDMDPTATPEDYSDILSIKNPGTLSVDKEIAMANFWSPRMDFSPGADPADFYLRPKMAAEKYPTVSDESLGCWSTPFTLQGDVSEIVTYSVPLRLDGKFYGVLGIEMTLNYFKKQLPYAELSDTQNGVYMLALEGADGNLRPMIFSGQFRGIPTPAPVGKDMAMVKDDSLDHNSIYTVVAEDKRRWVGCRKELTLYPNNSPFEAESWVFMGLMDQNDLLDFAKYVTSSMLIAVILSTAVALAIAWMGAVFLMRPIHQLLSELRKSDPSRPLNLPKTHITEVDELAHAVEIMNIQVADTSSKLSQIIWAAGVSVGAFEHHQGQQTVFFTDQLFTLLGMDKTGNIDSAFMDKDDFFAHLQSLSQYRESWDPANQISVYCLPGKGVVKEDRWIRLKLVQTEDRLIGAVVDITKETLERKRVEFERDHDPLTRLLNRGAFQNQGERVFKRPSELKIAAFIMMDLDNLKYINDTYGHDSGDEYIRCAAGAVRRMSGARAVVGRISGDEFCLFLWGYDSKDELREEISRLPRQLKESIIVTADGNQFPVRASGGVAWYPDDADNLSDLKRYADFAMYIIKNTIKGEFTEFSRERYDKDSYLLHSREELNRIIDERLVDYHFQPIVNAKTAEIFGYEALMRSKSQMLRSPLEVLTLARAQSKLHQIEYLTWWKALESFSAQRSNFPPNCRLFVNSIPSQILNNDEIFLLEKNFLDVLPWVVLEITEEEKMDGIYTERKREWTSRWGGLVALDDFGTGYSGEAGLLDLMPNMVKIDISIVRDIDSDPDRQKIFQNLAGFCHERQIKVIAEGVETREELEMLILLGADFLQGYLLGRPQSQPQEVPQRVAEIITGALNCEEEDISGETQLKV